MKETGNYSGEGIFEAQDAPADLRIGVSAQSRQWSGSADEPGFYFLPVKKRIIALNDSVLHQKGGASGYKRSCHRGTGAGVVPAADGSACDIDTGGGQIRFGKRKGGKSLPGKGSKLIGIAVVGRDCDRTEGSGGDGERGFRIRDEKARLRIDAGGRRQPKIETSISNVDRNQLPGPKSLGNRLLTGGRKHFYINFLKDLIGRRFSEEPVQVSIVEVRLIGPDVIFIEKYRFARWGSETDLKFIGKIFPKLDI